MDSTQKSIIYKLIRLCEDNNYKLVNYTNDTTFGNNRATANNSSGDYIELRYINNCWKRIEVPPNMSIG